MTSKMQTFLINVNIMEGKHYIWTNMDSVVIVKIDNFKKCTAMKEKNDCPFYNENFVFEFSTSLDLLLQKYLTITVIQPRRGCRKRKILGFVTLDILTVWSQHDHQFYHKWAILDAPMTESFNGPRGYLKIDIFIVSKGEAPKIPTNIINDTIEGNLLIPEGSYKNRQRVVFLFTIYNCKNLSSQTNFTSTYIQIQFAGNKIKSSSKKNSGNPEFNECLKLNELFPPLCQRFKIELFHGESLKTPFLSSTYINLRSISNDKDDGFLPTFGPSFLHFYSFSNLQGYVGSLLIEISTELLLEEVLTSAKSKKEPDLITPINEIVQFDYQEFFLMASIFDVTAINKRFAEKPVSFCLSFANKPGVKEIFRSSTVPQKPKKINKNYYAIEVENEKPGLDINITLPDLRLLMYNVNMLEKIISGTSTRMDQIEELIVNKHSSTNDIHNELVALLDYIVSSSKIYLNRIQSYNLKYATNLEKKKLKNCESEITQVIEILDKFVISNNKTHSFCKISKHFKRIECLMDDEQELFPDVFLWMISGTKKVAYVQIPARKILYSLIEEEKGEICSALTTIYFKSKELILEKEITCKMEVIFWLGLVRHKEFCFDNLPTSFTNKQIDNKLYLTTDSKPTIFQCRAHIYQAHIYPGLDKSGLSDSFAQIIVFDKSRKTNVIECSLNPVWDQMLVIKQIKLYGSHKFIKRNPPTIVVEVLDKDPFMQTEFIGRCIIIPIIKFANQTYSAPDFPPKLKWYKLTNEKGAQAEILAAIEFLEQREETEDSNMMEKEDHLVNIPLDIKPQLTNYKIEIIFWGVRNLKKVNCIQINKPRVSIYVGDMIFQSDTLVNAKKHSNFINFYQSNEIMLPYDKEYIPPIYIHMSDSRLFGVYVLSGLCTSKIDSFVCDPFEEQRSIIELNEIEPELLIEEESTSEQSASEQEEKVEPVEKPSLLRKLLNICHCLNFNAYKRKSIEYKKVVSPKVSAKRNNGMKKHSNVKEYEDENLNDWWTKFFVCTEGITEEIIENKYKMKIYQSELELQPEFKGFSDMLTSFEMYKGKRTGDETVDEENITGIFKGTLKVYRWPSADHRNYLTTGGGSKFEDGILKDFPQNNPLRYVLRVYCVRAIGLRPMDLNGKSDPYLVLNLNNKIINDKENYCKSQLNPIFGRCFEFDAVFPQDNKLIISLWDWDAVSKNDLIGETRIDVENRYFTKFRANCGLPETYEEKGWNTWRDQYKPWTILETLCKIYKISNIVLQETSLQVGPKIFKPADFEPTGDPNFDKQVLALYVLKHWQDIPVIGFPLVPEYIETRSLYSAAKPGIEQGKLQLWIDIFPYTDAPIPPKVNITPRKPSTYELRVIIWNTDEVQLVEDDFFSGEKKADIFVTGWMINPEQAQYTDVHYRSLTGEGNFNWRFVFRFDYLPSEKKIVVKRKEKFFSIGETEQKFPCTLTLQVWDNDTISANDFIGSVSMELWRLPRGAKSTKACSLSMLENDAPTLNLFKVRRTKGWWPLKCFNIDQKKDMITGKVEAEFELLPIYEAEKAPAGVGRLDPQKLPPPNRPDTSFIWFKNPWKTFKYVVCKLHRWKIIKAFLFIGMVFFIAAAIYSLPGYSVKKFLGV